MQSVRGDVLSKIRDVCARPPTDSEVEDASHCHLRVLENFEELDEMRPKLDPQLVLLVCMLHLVYSYCVCLYSMCVVYCICILISCTIQYTCTV